MIEIQKQLSVYLKNEPGELARICTIFSEHDINIEAITVVDTVDHAVDRLIVDKPEEAEQLLKGEGLLVVDHDVLTFDLKNKPGSLGHVADMLAEHDINIEYAYCTANPTQQEGFMVAKVSDPSEALDLLKQTADVDTE